MPLRNPVLMLGIAVGVLAGCGPRPQTLFASSLQDCSGAPPAGSSLRVVSFNIRAALDSSVEQIAEALDTLHPDLVALQEVDVGVRRSGLADQPRRIAELLGAEYVFAATIPREGGEYGVALLSRLPIASARRIDLDAAGAFEPRVAIDAEVCVGSQALRVVATHADIFPWSRDANARDIANTVRGSSGAGLVVAGDLNAAPLDQAPRTLEQLGLDDIVGEHAEGPTFFGADKRIDYVFADSPLATPSAAERIQVRLSDHIPVVADLSVGSLLSR